MLAGLNPLLWHSLGIALLAQVAGQAPANPAPAPAPSPTQPETADRCPVLANAQPGEILVCGQRPQGYRLDPDVMEASRGMHGGGRPKRPDRMRDSSCSVVGAAGCIGGGAGINIVGAVLTAAEMAARLAKGQEIGSMFITDPQPTEYQRYIEAKRRREADEAQAAQAAKAKAKTAAAAEKAEASSAQ